MSTGVLESVTDIRSELLDLITALGDDRRSHWDSSTNLLVDDLLVAANQLGRVEHELSDRPGREPGLVALR